ncbi:MAG: hypothetical protein II901_01770 [Paludibacteraceae bacterium]|nr:hypothetical protein [Paludibacteraceae bacterium]
MKKFFSFLCATLIVFSASAAPVKKAESLKQVKAEQIVKAGKVDAPRSINASSLRKARKAESDYVVITEQPAGELRTYSRGGGHYYVSNQQLYYENQSGSIDIVFGDENKVYFKDIISGLEYGTWVEGTLSADGASVTVALDQNLRYVANYDACIAIKLLNYVAGSGFSVDETATEVTFLYDAVNDIFELQGTSFGGVSLAGVWTDDGTIQNYGDYESVYSPYEAPQLVVLPDGATAEAYVMDYLNASSEACAKLVNVAVVEDSVYFQGMSENIPTSWVKGIKAGDQVTFAANQFMGEAEGYESYAFYSGEAVFTFDSEENKYSALGEIYGVLGGRWYDGRYTNPVLTKSKEPDFDNPIEVAITDVAYKYDSEYQDVIYELSNATADTVVVLDIKLASGEDIELGVTYTLADMYPEATYTYLEIGGSKSALQSISFVKQNVSGDFFSVEATLVDAKSNVFHLTGIFEDVPPVAYEPVVVPAGLETATYKFVGIDTYYDSEETKYIQVGFDEDTVYFQGLSYYVPEGWIKGTVAADGSVTLDPCLVGLFSYFGYEFNVIFGGGSMQYDAALDQFTCAEFITVDEEGNNLDEYSDVIITRFTEVAATPADPEFTNFVFADATYPKVNFTIPLEGTNGEDLNPDKLSYIFFTDKSGTIAELVLDPSEYTQLTAPMTEIPYTFSDDYDIYDYVLYLNQSEEEVRSWSRLGLQSIYRGAGEENKSNVVWFDVAAYWAEVDGPAEGIEETLAEGKAVKVVRDNQIIILKGDKAFNAVGNRVK